MNLNALIVTEQAPKRLIQATTPTKDEAHLIKDLHQAILALGQVCPCSTLTIIQCTTYRTSLSRPPTLLTLDLTNNHQALAHNMASSPTRYRNPQISQNNLIHKNGLILEKSSRSRLAKNEILTKHKKKKKSCQGIREVQTTIQIKDRKGKKLMKIHLYQQPNQS